MILTTTEKISGKEISQIIGMVKGNTIRARNVGRDILAIAKNVVGGEIKEYTALMAQSREQAIDRMKEEAEKKGADAIVSVRITTSSVTAGAAEILAYGTAVKLN